MIADICDRALQNLEAGGWCQHRARGDHGEQCLREAVVHATGQLQRQNGTGGLSPVPTVRALIANIPDDGIVAWNDADGREFHEVRELLKRTADQHRP